MQKNNNFLFRFFAVVLLSFLCLAAVSACGNTLIQPYSFEDAVRDGTISSFVTEDIPEDDLSSLEIVTPTMQQLTISGNVLTSVVFPVEQILHFVRNEGDIEMMVEEYQIVAKDDLLAQLTYETDEVNQIYYDFAIDYLERFEQEIINERRKKQTEISKARRDMSSASGSLRQMLATNVRLLEIDLERYTINSNITRSNLEKEAAITREFLGFEDITAPFDGIVTNIFEGNKLYTSTRQHSNMDMMKISDPSVFFFQASIHTNPLRPFSNMAHGDIVSVRGFYDMDEEDDDDDRIPDLEFEARIVSDHWAAGQWNFTAFLLSPTDKDALLKTLSELGDPAITLLNTRFYITVEYVASPPGLTLPTVALRHDSAREDRYHVLILNNGILEKRYVEIGNILNNYIYILYGIDEDSKVVIAR